MVGQGRLLGRDARPVQALGWGSVADPAPGPGGPRRWGVLRWSLCLLAAMVGPVAGQITVEIELEQQQFLPGEPLPIAVRITNLSGQPLSLGEDHEWLSISIEGQDNRVVRRLGDLPVYGPFVLESSQRATRRLDVAPYFELTRQGRYRMQATVRIAAWDREFVSPAVGFDIITGARLWEREFGVPAPEPGSPPVMRKYILQEANYLKRNLRLYVRITDPAETQILRVLPLGPIVSFANPQPQLDGESNLHLLFQNGRTTCAYYVIRPDGEIAVRQTWEIAAGSRPRLSFDNAGRVVVVGGVRRYAPTDIPPSLSGSSPAVPDPVTNSPSGS